MFDDITQKRSYAILSILVLLMAPFIYGISEGKTEVAYKNGKLAVFCSPKSPSVTFDVKKMEIGDTLSVECATHQGADIHLGWKPVKDFCTDKHCSMAFWCGDPLVTTLADYYWMEKKEVIKVYCSPHGY